MMTETEVLNLMRSSKSEAEWNDNCDIVKKKCDGYPGFWFGLMIVSGELAEIQNNW